MITSRARKRQHEQIHYYAKIVVKFIFFILFLVIFSLFIEKCKTYFPIRSVKVFGVHNAGQDVLQQALSPLVTKGFFAIDVESIKDRLLQSPWITQASVQRVWPDQVIISIVEKIPIARWNSSSLLSSTGEIFNDDSSHYPNNLPQFFGGEGRQIQMMQYYKKLANIFTPLHFKIVRMELTPEFSWNLTFDNGMKLTAGRKELLTRLNHFVKVYPKIIGNRLADVDYIDLRYPNGLAVKWKTLT